MNFTPVSKQSLLPRIQNMLIHLAWVTCLPSGLQKDPSQLVGSGLLNDQGGLPKRKSKSVGNQQRNGCLFLSQLFLATSTALLEGHWARSQTIWVYFSSMLPSYVDFVKPIIFSWLYFSHLLN